MHQPPAAPVTPGAPYGAPPSYCSHCSELSTIRETAATEVACPSCGAAVRPAAGRFAGIVNVVRFVADLPQPRRTALHAALQPDRRRDHETAEAPADLRWLTEWLANHDMATSTFWRRCLVLATQLVPVGDQLLDEPRLLGIAREVARQAGASQSFTPRQY